MGTHLIQTLVTSGNTKARITYTKGRAACPGRVAGGVVVIMKMARRFIVQPVDEVGRVLSPNLVVKLGFWEHYGLPLFTFIVGLAVGAVWGVLQ